MRLLDNSDSSFRYHLLQTAQHKLNNSSLSSIFCVSQRWEVPYFVLSRIDGPCSCHMFSGSYIRGMEELVSRFEINEKVYKDL